MLKSTKRICFPLAYFAEKWYNNRVKIGAVDVNKIS